VEAWRPNIVRNKCLRATFTTWIKTIGYVLEVCTLISLTDNESDLNLCGLQNACLRPLKQCCFFIPSMHVPNICVIQTSQGKNAKHCSGFWGENLLQNHNTINSSAVCLLPKVDLSIQLNYLNIRKKIIFTFH